MTYIFLQLAAILWLSLASASAGEIHIIHCLKGCPAGTPQTNDLVINNIFALSSNDKTKFADWVSYRVTRETMGTTDSFQRKWTSEAELDDTETLEAADYKGANRTLKTDRGHLAPSSSFAGTVFWRQTNRLSNITPQKSSLNRGAWRALEQAVRDLAYKVGAVWVVTGPLYEREMPQLPGADEAHQVPSGYFKVVADKNGRVAGFIFDQETPRRASICNHTASLTNIERRSGLDLFPMAPVGWLKETASIRSGLGC